MQRQAHRIAILLAMSLFAAHASAQDAERPEEKAFTAYIEARSAFETNEEAASDKAFAAYEAAKKAEPSGDGPRIRASLELLQELGLRNRNINLASSAARDLSLRYASDQQRFWESLDSGELTHWMTGLRCGEAAPEFSEHRIYMYSGTGTDTSCEVVNPETGVLRRTFMTWIGADAASPASFGTVVAGMRMRGYEVRTGRLVFDSPRGEIVAQEAITTVNGIRSARYVTSVDQWVLKVWLDQPRTMGDEKLRDRARRSLSEAFAKLDPVRACEGAALETGSADPAQAPSQDERLTGLLTALLASAVRPDLPPDLSAARAAGYVCPVLVARTADGSEVTVFAPRRGVEPLKLGDALLSLRVEVAGGPDRGFWIVALQDGAGPPLTVAVRRSADGADAMQIGRGLSMSAVSMLVGDSLLRLPMGHVLVRTPPPRGDKS